MTHDHLTDYQVANAFGDTLSLIYKEKMQELNDDLSPMYSHLDSLAIPQIPEFHRWFARATMPDWAQERFKAIDHINKIRRLYKNIKNNPEDLSVEKARAIPISSIYDFKFKGKNVSCPYHEDSHPSASIKYNRLVCFSCGVKHDGIALMMNLNKFNFKQAVEYLNKL